MAGKTIPYTSSLAETQIRQGLVLENERVTRVFALKGDSPDSAIVELEDENADRGSTTKIRFRPIVKDRRAKTSPTQIVGNEATRDEYEASIDVRYFIPTDGAVESPYADQQNVSFDLEENEQLSMAAETGEWFERGIMNQISGNTTVNDTTYANRNYDWSCGNIVTNYDAAHHFYATDASGANTTEAQVAADATATLKVSDVSDALSRLRSRRDVSWPMAPAQTPWGRKFVVLADSEGLRQARQSAPDSEFRDLTLAMIQGGADPMGLSYFTGEGFLGPENTIYLETDYACFGLSGVADGATTVGTLQNNCMRAVILGARGAHIKWGMGFTGGLHLGYTEHDVHGRKSMAIHTNFGVRRLEVNSQAWGAAIVSYYVTKNASQ